MRSHYRLSPLLQLTLYITVTVKVGDGSIKIASLFNETCILLVQIPVAC
jgi:hypothetical protein